MPVANCCDIWQMSRRNPHWDYLQVVACIAASQLDCAKTALSRRVFEPSLLGTPLRAYTLGRLYRIADPSEQETVRVWSNFPNEIAMALVAQARRLTKEGRILEAEQKYLLAIRVQGQFPAAYAELGTLYENSGQMDDAMGAYKQAIEQGTNYAGVYMSYGWWLFEKEHEPDLAIQVFEQGLSRNPAYAWLMIRIGQVYRSQGAYSSAAEWYLRAVELSPDDAYAELYAGMNYVEWQHFDLAVPYLSRASELSPTWPLPSYYLGKALLGAGDYAHSRFLLKRAIDLAGAGAEWSYYADLSEAASLDGDCSEALQALATAKRLEPSAQLDQQQALLESHCGR